MIIMIIVLLLLQLPLVLVLVVVVVLVCAAMRSTGDVGLTSSCGSNRPFYGLGYVLELTGIQLLVLHIKAIGKKDLVPL